MPSFYFSDFMCLLFYYCYFLIFTRYIVVDVAIGGFKLPHLLLETLFLVILVLLSLMNFLV